MKILRLPANLPTLLR